MITLFMATPQCKLNSAALHFAHGRCPQGPLSWPGGQFTLRPIQSANLSFAYVQARHKCHIDILCTAPFLLEHEHEETSRNSGTDYTCNVRTHSMHQKEVSRVLFRTNCLRYTGCHRNSGYTGGTDKRVDLALC